MGRSTTRSPRPPRFPRAWALVGLASLAAACVVAAAGAGAGGGIYFTQRGVESVVPASVARAAAATSQAFAQLKIRQTKSTTEQADNGGEKREIDGSASDRDVGVTIVAEGNGSRVQVVAKTSAVTWDKDYARAVLDKIVANSR
jgi:hypothetical protein